MIKRYFSPSMMAFYTDDMFPVDKMPSDKKQISDEDFRAIYSRINSPAPNDYVLGLDDKGNPVAVTRPVSTN